MFCTQIKEDLARVEKENQQKQDVLNAIDKSLAVIEFDLEGNILHANANFLAAVGYELDEIVNKHHRIFVTDAYMSSDEYAEFWTKLKSGQFFSGRFKRVNKQGDEIWIEASYNPIKDSSGHPYKVMKFATDITSFVTKEQDYKGQIDSINKTMAVIEFDTTGNILKTNDNFRAATGYSEAELQGKHHRMFVLPDYAESEEYVAFWRELAEGKSKSGTYHLVNKAGEDLWLEATYNAIYNADGEVIKVVKYATDVSANENTKLLKEVVHDAGVVMEAYAKGDLTAKMQNHLEGKENSMFAGEVELLTCSVSNMVENLSNIITEVLSSSNHVHRAASEVKDSSLNLSQRVQEQAAALEETSATMDQMNSSVQANKQSAHHAAEEARAVQSQAGDGEMVMQKTVDAINAIEESSHQIKDIVSLIDSIAFQTNLLALNAAVEAARAGEHGRGFAVVAGEVRALAQKSAGAAKEINELISNSTERVAQGVLLAQQSGDSLEKINSAIKGVVDMIDHIASSSDEQAIGINQVHQAITQIDSVTQQNAALVEQTSASAETMKGESTRLEENMSFFNN